MSRLPKKRPAIKPKSETASRGKAGALVQTKLTKRKILFFKLLALVIVPVLFFGALELALRLFGFGYPTHFVLSSKQNDQAAFVQNNQFGWRFFGAGMARMPKPFCVPREKTPDTIRVVVFGESAALGDPQPEFGVSRMLQAMLELHYPGTHFEVINAGIVAINSNVILPIAQDCAKLKADIWVIYMGNNEVVGPFGAGTVFGRQVPPLPVIRTILALKSTRIGQAADLLLSKIAGASANKADWGGMEMFLNQQVALHDPRMAGVYDHFAKNLADIIRIGQRSGAGIVVSTVAVNLKDCAPFASLHRTGMNSFDEQNWQKFFQNGTNAEKTVNIREATEWYDKAARVDDQFAELHFRQGACLSALGNDTNASAQFSLARDLDALRFRCDHHLNDLIRQIVSNFGKPNILLADAEHSFAKQSPGGIPGEEFFYEHVHLTFEGNYLLALTLVPEIQKLLPANISSQSSQNKAWPSIIDCARRLAWSKRDQKQALTDIISRLNNPPFTGQLDHERQVSFIKEAIIHLSSEATQTENQAALGLCRTALSEHPNDTDLLGQGYKLKQMSGDLAGAEQLAQKAIDLLPNSPEDWSQLGVIFAKQKKYDRAATAFQKAFDLNPEDVWALQNLAQALKELGRTDEAVREYKRALAIKPRFGLAWLGLGQIQEEAGNKNEAEACYQRALQNRILRAPELTALARFCETRNWLEAAATNYQDVIKLDPSDPKIYLAAGQNFSAIGRRAEAEKYFSEAATLAPGSVQALFLYGTELGRDGKAAEAAKQFQKVISLMPDMTEAHLNLGISLADSGNYPEAIVQFEQVLKKDPNNLTATRYLNALQIKP